MQLALTSPIGGYYTKGQGIGRTGDFVTSPEISQMFGEIMAVWFVLHWEMFGRPQNTVFVELGPGKGTLMDDMLRAAQRFPQFYAALKGVHLVERSPELRREQFKKLKCQHGQAEMTNEQAPKRAVTSRGNLPVEWHDVLDEVCAKEAVPLVMAHEFFDALPIYKFERGADDLWHEILVDIEVSPESAQVMTQLAKWISARNGMGLVVDYGQNWTQGDTFRGIKSHKFANPLSSPGSMDLTADVDFSYLSYAANGLAQCHGPMEQGAFLHAMGIQARLQQLLQTTRETQMHKRLVECYKRLTDPHSMGRIYKVMAVLPESAQQTPVPFSNIQKAA
ncbi:S-adenosyl-L-methionine-dependent methyltransferase [Coemansia mojavensis]|nr:S-adenosyl-L-methionine-dependent methyltransferase [Coemansia mojavensis]